MLAQTFCAVIATALITVLSTRPVVASQTVVASPHCEAQVWVEDMAVDHSGSVCIAGGWCDEIDLGGGSLPGSGYFDIYVGKFDSSGNHLWSKSFGSEGWQFVEGLAIDASGNVYLGGYFQNELDFGGGPLTSSGTDIFIAKLDANGNHIWSKSFVGELASQYCYDVCVDAGGFMYITGEMWGTVDFGGGPLTDSGHSDVFVAKFDIDGHHVWSENYGTLYTQIADCISVNDSMQVCIFGENTGIVDFGGGPITSPDIKGLYIAMFDSSGAHIWSEGYGDSMHMWTGDLATGPNGEVIVTGSFQGTIDFGGGTLVAGPGVWDSIFLAKFGSAGAHVWSYTYPTTSHDDGNGIAAYSNGDVALTGDFKGNIDFGGGWLIGAGDDDAFLCRFTSTGNHVFSKPFGDSYWQEGRRVVVDDGDNVLMAGNFEGRIDLGGGVMFNVGGEDVFLGKFDPDGDYLWSITFGNSIGTGIGDTPISVITEFSVFPNPFNPETTFSYAVNKSGVVRICIFDVSGRMVRLVIEEQKAPGRYTARWNGTDDTGSVVGSGVYFARLTAREDTKEQKILLIK